MRFGVDIVPVLNNGSKAWKVGAFAQFEENGQPTAGRILHVVVDSEAEAERIATEIQNLIQAVDAATTVKITAEK